MGVKCPKCNTDNPDDTLFCGKCGTNLPSSKDVSVSRTKTIQTPKEKLTSEKPFAGRYQILEELGRGGMGIVYKAKDTRLKRTVALKFVPPELTHISEVKERFIREAQAAAALEHPNICTVYEVDETEGKTFISMAYVEGQSLKGKIEYGPLTMNLDKRTVTAYKKTLELTSKEFDLLLLMMQSPGKAYSRSELLELVWGYNFKGYEHTVNTHINRLVNHTENIKPKRITKQRFLRRTA